MFTTERGGPFTPDAVNRLVKRIGERAGFPFQIHAHMLRHGCGYHDRLLLGLSGIMSEAELHQIRMRLHQGERQKAARGELRLPLPAGLLTTEPVRSSSIPMRKCRRVCTSSSPNSRNCKAHAA